MTGICRSELPEDALSFQYKVEGAITDCYYIDIPKEITLIAFIQAFYTTPLFKLERILLSIFAKKPSNDQDADDLANGLSQVFSIWTVEAREANQILLRDFTGNTRSWLMACPLSPGRSRFTRLYFGSVLVQKPTEKNERKPFGSFFYLLSGFHHLYSRVLLKSAVAELVRPEPEI